MNAPYVQHKTYDHEDVDADFDIALESLWYCVAFMFAMFVITLVLLWVIL